MFLKKVVEWISHNHQLKPPDNPNEFFTEKSESYNESLANNVSEEILTASSSGGKTSVLDLYSAPETINKDVSYETKRDVCDEIAAEFLLGSGDSVQNNQINLKHVEHASDEDKLECKRNLLTNMKDNDQVIAKNINNQPFLTPHNTLKPLAFTKKYSDVNCYTVPDVKMRSTFTQTHLKSTRRHNKSYEFNKKYIAPNTLEKDGADHSLPTSGSYSAFSPFMRDLAENGTKSTVYGTLFVFGYSNASPEAGKIKAKFVLRKRAKANGLQEAFSYVKSDSEPLSNSPAQHIISYPLPNNRSIIVAFKRDPLTDIFQIGRHETHPVDFKVDDINSSSKARHGVSRFACRIAVRRDGNHEARVYAAAYDSSKSIFLGEAGIPCSYRGKMDGFTTNGVLVLQPGDHREKWREVSVSGYIYPLRSSQMEIAKRPRLTEESNILRDGTLIDLCGVTLIYRTPEGMKKTHTEEFLRRLQLNLHRSVPECRLLSRDSTLLASQAQWATKRAFVYLSCGHVIGLVLPEPPENAGKGWSCPVCRVIGPIIQLTIGTEPCFHLDRKFPSYAFKPCGHAASQKTVEYWSSIEIPKHRSIQNSHCPFCGVQLNFITKYVKLTLPIPEIDS